MRGLALVKVSKNLIDIRNNGILSWWIMAEIGLRTRMLVKDVMTSPAVTVPENTPVDKTAQLMGSDKLVV